MAMKRQRPSKVSTMTPVERMIAGKKKLIRRLEKEIVDARMNAEREVENIQFRIRQAQTILHALEKGTLVAG